MAEDRKITQVSDKSRMGSIGQSGSWHYMLDSGDCIGRVRELASGEHRAMPQGMTLSYPDVQEFPTLSEAVAYLEECHRKEHHG